MSSNEADFAVLSLANALTKQTINFLTAGNFLMKNSVLLM
jgi:hypothetical protein